METTIFGAMFPETLTLSPAGTAQGQLLLNLIRNYNNGCRRPAAITTTPDGKIQLHLVDAGHADYLLRTYPNLFEEEPGDTPIARRLEMM
jgi:hypothetical protein